MPHQINAAEAARKGEKTKTYEFYKTICGKEDEWLERNIAGLCGDCEMVRAAGFDAQSDAYIVAGCFILYVTHSSEDIIEAVDEDWNVVESWRLD